MDTQARKAKKEVKAREITNDDMLHIFLSNKIKDNVKAPFLSIKRNRVKGLSLYYKDFTVSEPSLIAELGKVNDKPVLVISPELCTKKILTIIFGSFSNEHIFWKKGLIPLTIDKALEIHESRINESV